jgi:hypothetical protein
MSKKTRSPKTSNKGLQGVLQEELADLDQTLEGLAEREERLHDELQSLRMERAQKQELREHALALLEHTQQPPSASRPTASAKTAMAGLPDMVEAPDRYPLGRRKAKISDTLAQAVYETLKGTEPANGEPGEPMHYRELVTALEGRRVYISGRDPGLNLVAHIHKDSRFVRPQRGMYALKEWYPGAQHNVGGRANKKI